MEKRSIGLIAAIIAIVLFFGVNVLANAALRSVRVDLTEEQLYTLSEGSKNIARDVDEPIRLYFFYSESGGRQYPLIKDYAGRVRDVLDEFVANSDGNLILEIIDPEPYSEAEEQAVREGILPMPLPSGDPLYFGLVGTNATDDREVMPYLDAFDPAKQRFLEYELSRMIYTLANPDKNRVAILSSLPLEGMPQNPMMQQQQGPPPWKILAHLNRFFDTVMMAPTDTEIPADTDVLVVIHPKDLSNATLFAIDQYVLGGGKLIAFVDPHCEADPAGQQNPMQPQPGASAASDLNRLFQSWGFEMVTSKVAGDRKNALRVQYQDGQRLKEGPFVVWLQLGEDALDPEDAITSRPDLGLRMNSPGILQPLPDAKTTFTPLVQTSEESMEIDGGMLLFRPNPDALMRNFVPGFQKLTLAARITGEARTAFPEGDPAGAPDAPENGEPEEAADATATGPELTSGAIQMIAVADVDMLADRQWVQEQRLMNISLGLTKLSDNGDFLVNAIENLLGGNDLISIQSRGNYARPFERVDQIRLDAEQRFRSEEMELERKLQEVTRRIQELQSESAPGSTVLVPDDLAQQIAQAKQDELDTKRALRNVQLDMRKDIERLGTRLKWMNIGLIPVLISAAAIALGAWRVQRRSSR